MISDGCQVHVTVGFVARHAAHGLLQQEEQLSITAVFRGELLEDIEDHPGRDTRAEQFDLSGCF